MLDRLEAGNDDCSCWLLAGTIQGLCLSVGLVVGALKRLLFQVIAFALI